MSCGTRQDKSKYLTRRDGGVDLKQKKPIAERTTKIKTEQTNNRNKYNIFTGVCAVDC
jgi:hypothetical protein